MKGILPIIIIVSIAFLMLFQPKMPKPLDDAENQIRFSQKYQEKLEKERGSILVTLYDGSGKMVSQLDMPAYEESREVWFPFPHNIKGFTIKRYWKEVK